MTGSGREAPPSGRSDWLLFNLGRGSPTPELRGPPGPRPAAPRPAPPLARRPFRRILTLRVRPSPRRALRARGVRGRPGRREGKGEREGTEGGAEPEGNKEGKNREGPQPAPPPPGRTARGRGPPTPARPGDSYGARRGCTFQADTYRPRCPPVVSKFPFAFTSRPPPLAQRGWERGARGAPSSGRGRAAWRSAAATFRSRLAPAAAPLSEFSEASSWGTCSPGPARGPRVRHAPLAAAAALPPPSRPRSPSLPSPPPPSPSPLGVRRVACVPL